MARARKQSSPVAEEAPPPVQLYKVLRNGLSWHGGTFAWSLPTKNDDGTWKPGDWHEVEGTIELCRHGLHLTDSPMQWYGEGATIYAVEAEGVVGLDKIESAPDRKVVARRVRLMREVPPGGYLDAVDTKQVIAAAKSKAREIVEKAEAEANKIIGNAWSGDTAKRRVRAKERAEALRVASLTPRQRESERRAGKAASSPAYLLAVTLVHGRGSRSDRSCDDAVYSAFLAAIEHGARFDVEDVRDVGRAYRVHWGADCVALENLYERSVKAGHESAQRSIERALGRRPWRAHGATFARGTVFQWEGLRVRVTSFDGDEAVVACAYERTAPKKKPCGCPNWSNDEKLARRFKITRAAFEAAFRPKKAVAA